MNVFELAASITLDTAKYRRELGQAKSASHSFASGFGSVFQKAGSIGMQALSAAASAGAAAITAAATGISAITTKAVSSYAEYQQMVGGVETLFGNSANTVKNYANQAYETAGMSANDYMDTITSFSASLLQSLGGDTAKAAEYGNRAVIDMSD